MMASLSMLRFADLVAEEHYRDRLGKTARARRRCFVCIVVATIAFASLLVFNQQPDPTRHASNNRPVACSACFLGLGFAACLLLQLYWPLHGTDSSLVTGLARVLFVCWNGLFWSLSGVQLSTYTKSAVSSPVLSCTIAAALGKVHFDAFVVQHVGSVAAMWWLAQTAGIATTTPMPGNHATHLIVALLLPAGLALAIELWDRQAFHTEWLGERPSGASGVQHAGRALRRALRLQPVPFASRFMEASYADLALPSRTRDAALHAPFAGMCAALLLLLLPALLPQQQPQLLGEGAASCTLLSVQEEPWRVAAVAGAAVVGAAAAGAVLGVTALAGRAPRRYVAWRAVAGPSVQLAECAAVLLCLGGSTGGSARVVVVLAVANLAALGLLVAIRQGLLWPSLAAHAASCSATLAFALPRCAGPAWALGTAAACACCLAFPAVCAYRRETRRRWLFLSKVLWSERPGSHPTPPHTLPRCPSAAAVRRLEIVRGLLPRLQHLRSLLSSLLSPVVADTQAAVQELTAFALHSVGGPEALLCLGVTDRVHRLLRCGHEARLLEGVRLLLTLAAESRDVIDAALEQGCLHEVVRVACRAPASSALALTYALAALAHAHDLHVEAAAAGAARLAGRLLLLGGGGGCPQAAGGGCGDVSLQAAAAHCLMVLLSCCDRRVVLAVRRNALLPLLVRAAASAPPPACNSACSAVAFAVVSADPAAQAEVVQAGGLGALLGRLSPGEPMAATAAAALATLAGARESYRRQIREAGGINRLVPLMTSGSEETRAFAIYALEAVVSPRDPRASADFVGAQGVVPLVGLLSRGGTSGGGYAAATTTAGTAVAHPMSPPAAAAAVAARFAPSAAAAAAVSQQVAARRMDAGSALLGNLYSTNPSLRAQVMAATRMGPLMDVLMARGADGRLLPAAMAQILRDAQLARPAASNGLAKAA